MLLRVSAKFQRQYSYYPEKKELPVRPFPQTWNVDLLNHGRQLLAIASEEYTLFSVLIPISRARNIQSFLQPFQERLLQLFETLRLWQHRDFTQIEFTGRTDRRLIGSQNDLIRMARFELLEAANDFSSATLLKVEEFVNITPMSYLDMDSPDRKIWSEVIKVSQSRK